MGAKKKSAERSPEHLLADTTAQIRKAMNRRKVRQRDIAEAMGVSQAYVSNMLNGNGNYTLLGLRRLCDAIGIRLEIKLRG